MWSDIGATPRWSTYSVFSSRVRSSAHNSKYSTRSLRDFISRRSVVITSDCTACMATWAAGDCTGGKGGSGDAMGGEAAGFIGVAAVGKPDVGVHVGVRASDRFLSIAGGSSSSVPDD